MRRLINPLWMLWTQASQKDLVRQLEFLKEENRILRGKLGRQVRVSPRERERLITLGRRVGPMIRHLVSIVTPHTSSCWADAPS